MPRQGRKPELIENLIARGSRTPRVKAHTPGNLPVCQEPRPDYPPNLLEGARPYFDSICGHLEKINRLNPAFGPAATTFANLQYQLDKITLVVDSEAATFRDNIRHKDLVGMVQRYQDRFYMTPDTLEGVSVKKDPPKPVENQPAKAALRGRK